MIAWVTEMLTFTLQYARYATDSLAKFKTKDEGVLQSDTRTLARINILFSVLGEAR